MKLAIKAWIRHLRRVYRHPRVVKRYPARFRTTRPQPLRELGVWVRDQFDAESRGFDAEYGTATSWFDLGNYEPTPPSVIREVLDDLARAVPLPEVSFVDLGSGKGRAVLLAAGRPFARVVGVEVRRALHRRAERNLDGFRGEIVTAPELVCADAREVSLPEGPLVLFLYNPFGPDVLDAVLDRVLDRDTWLLAVNPPNDAWLVERGFAVQHHQPHASDDRRWTRYFRAGAPTAAR